jgi:hypothetical protein
MNQERVVAPEESQSLVWIREKWVMPMLHIDSEMRSFQLRCCSHNRAHQDIRALRSLETDHSIVWRADVDVSIDVSAG